MTNKSKSIMNLRLLQNNWFLPKQSNFATCAKYQVRYWGGVKPKATPVRGTSRTGIISDNSEDNMRVSKSNRRYLGGTKEVERESM